MSGTPVDGADVLARPYVPDWSCRDDEPLQAVLNELYDYADDLESKVLHRSRLNRFHAISRGLASRNAFPSRERALDVGCNAGYYSKMISDLGFESVLGVDIEAEFIGRATRALGSDRPGRRRTFRVADAEQLSDRDAYDFVLCTEVIEHTRRPDRVVANLAAALKPGGIALVTLPNAVSLPYALGVASLRLKGKPIDPELRDHLSYPFHRSMRLFEPHGVRLIGTHGVNLLFTGPLLRTLYPSPMFGSLHRLNGALSDAWPLKFVSQFFYMVLRKDA